MWSVGSEWVLSDHHSEGISSFLLGPCMCTDSLVQGKSLIVCHSLSRMIKPSSAITGMIDTKTLEVIAIVM